MKKLTFVLMFLCIMVCGAKAKELVQYQQGVLASQTAMIALQDSLETIEDDLLEVVEERAIPLTGSFACGQDNAQMDTGHTENRAYAQMGRSHQI